MSKNTEPKKKIIVLGGSGFIGQHLITHLLNEGYIVCNFDKTKPKMTENWIQGDITNYSDMSEVLERINPEFIINLAAKTSLEGKKIYDYRENFLGISNLVQVLFDLKMLNVKFLHFSTQFVIAPNSNSSGFEDLDPYTTYGDAKAVAELILRSSVLTNWLIFRPSGVWGASHPTFPNGLWKIMKMRLFIQPEVLVLRSYIHVDTLATQVCRFLSVEWERVNKGTYYLGNEPSDPRVLMDAFSVKLTGKPCRRMNSRAFLFIFQVFQFLAKIGIKLPLDQQRYDVLTKNFIIDLKPTFDVIGLVDEDLNEAINKTFD